MKIREVLHQAWQTVGPEGDRLGCELLLAFVIGEPREFLLTHGEDEAVPAIVEKFLELFHRMLQGEPVAYLLGHKEFFGMDFIVDRRVLIPRPETEHLVEWVLEYLQGSDIAQPKILDVGTGSGCIALSIAKNLPAARVTGVDISSEALDVALLNAQRHNLTSHTEFFVSDLLAAVQHPFDIIVANLPYIGEKRFSFVSKSAQDYEPHVALFGGEDGLGLYDRFFQQLASQDWHPRMLVGEFGFLQRDELIRLFSGSFPGLQIRFLEDYAHIDRMFVVEWPPYV